MLRFLIRLIINAVALYVAIAVVNSTIGGIQLQNPSWVSFLWMGLIFGLVNALLRPLLTLLTCPLIMLTLGLFTLIINTFLFYLVGYLGTFIHMGYSVSSFWAALLGSVVLSVISVVLAIFIRDESRKHR